MRHSNGDINTWYMKKAYIKHDTLKGHLNNETLNGDINTIH